MKLRLIVVAALVLLAPATASACYAPPEHLTVHYSELIGRTANIVLAEVKRAERLPGEMDRYHFVTKEILKGRAERTFTLEVSHPGSPPNFQSLGTDFNRHRDPRFWDKKLSRQWNRPDCKMYPFFSVGSRYLLFLDEPYHWKSFERIIWDDDRWLAAVRKVIETKDKGVGFSQTIYDYLAEQRAVYLYQVERCTTRGPDKLWQMRQLDHLRGSKIGTSQFWPDFGGEFRPCAPGLTFLAVHYEGEYPQFLIHPSAFPVEDGVADFSNIETEIEIVGERKIPLQELKRRLR